MPSPKRTDDQRRARVVRVGEGLLRWLGLWQQYYFAFKFSDSLPASPATSAPGANVVQSYPYRQIVVTFDRKLFDEADDTQLETLLLHEAMHIPWAAYNAVLQDVKVTKAQHDALFQAEEHIVDLTAHLIDRLRPRWGYHESGVPWPHDPKRKKRE